MLAAIKWAVVTAGHLLVTSWMTCCHLGTLGYFSHVCGEYSLKNLETLDSSPRTASMYSIIPVVATIKHHAKT